MSAPVAGPVPLDGARYRTVAPDTLDLASRAALALNSLTQLINREVGYVGYHRLRLYTNPPVMYLPDYQTSCEMKIVEALPLLRVMSGSDVNHAVDPALVRAYLGQVADDGLFYFRHTAYPARARAWPRLGPHVYPSTGEDFVTVYGEARLMLALMVWRQLDGDPAWSRVIQ